MSRLPHLILLLLVLLFALPAAAVGGRMLQPLQRIGPVGCPYMDIDMCFHDGDWWISSGGSLGSGTACSLSGGCWTCLANVYGKKVCAYGVSSGGCDCGNVPRDGAGPGITDCVPTGSCTFRQNP